MQDKPRKTLKEQFRTLDDPAPADAARVNAMVAPDRMPQGFWSDPPGEPNRWRRFWSWFFLGFRWKRFDR